MKYRWSLPNTSSRPTLGAMSDVYLPWVTCLVSADKRRRSAYDICMADVPSLSVNKPVTKSTFIILSAHQHNRSKVYGLQDSTRISWAADMCIVYITFIRSATPLSFLPFLVWSVCLGQMVSSYSYFCSVFGKRGFAVQQTTQKWERRPRGTG